MMSGARILGGLVAFGLAAGVCASVGLMGAAASEATPSADILVSTDGIHFSSALDGGLFDQSGLLIPGGSVASSLWIRNPTSEPAEVRVSARNVTVSDSAFADAVTMDAWDSGTDATRSRTLRLLARCDILVPAQPIAAGATIKSIVTFTMSDLRGVTAQGEKAGLNLMVAMRDGEAGPFPASACDDNGMLISSAPARMSPSPAGSLASTGTDFVVPFLATGGFLVGIGLFFVAGRRRREHDES